MKKLAVSNVEMAGIQNAQFCGSRKTLLYDIWYFHSQVTEQSVLSNNCDDKQLCIVSILPHILDCQSKCRNDYISMLKRVGEHFKSKMWG